MHNLDIPDYIESIPYFYNWNNVLDYIRSVPYFYNYITLPQAATYRLYVPTLLQI